MSLRSEIRNQKGVLFLLFILLFFTEGCASNGKEVELPGSETEKNGAPTTLSNSFSNQSTQSPRLLEEKFYTDSDGNAIPDFIEAELGFNPQADDCPYKNCGQEKEGESLDTREQNTLLILDSSGSMKASGKNGQSKMAAAKNAIDRYFRTISGVHNLGFMAYGHRGDNSQAGKAASCAGVELLAPIGEARRENFSSVLTQFEPTGWTPIAGALTKTREAFAGRENAANRIILVSDGIETCGGDPVAAAKELHDSGFRVRVDVVGFDVGKQDAENLRKIAEVTGGEYTDAKSGADLDEYLKKQTRAVYETRAAITCEIANLMHTPLCNQQLVNKSLFYLDRLRQEAANRQMRARQSEQSEDALREQQQAEAYLDLINRISAARDERERKSREAVPRYRELEQKMNELGRQMREVYGIQ